MENWIIIKAFLFIFFYRGNNDIINMLKENSSLRDSY